MNILMILLKPFRWLIKAEIKAIIKLKKAIINLKQLPLISEIRKEK